MNARILLFSIPLFSVMALAGCAEQARTPAAEITTSTTKTMEDTQSKQLTPPAAGDTIAVIETDFGTIKMKLFTEQVPEMTKNFEELAKDGKFNGVPFHRVIKDFMIQSGDFEKKDGTGGYSYKGPGTTMDAEIAPSLKHLFGTVSMARKPNDVNSNSSQFFIVTAKNGFPSLDGQYTIFGQVYEGMDVAEKIADLFIPSSGQRGTPSKIVNMTKVTVMPYSP